PSKAGIGKILCGRAAAHGHRQTLGAGTLVELPIGAPNGFGNGDRKLGLQKTYPDGFACFLQGRLASMKMLEQPRNVGLEPVLLKEEPISVRGGRKARGN